MSKDKKSGPLMERPLNHDPYISVFEKHPQVVFILDVDGYIQDCNPAACNILGYTRDEIINRRVGFVTSKESKHHIREAFERTITGISEEIEVLPVCTKQGERVYVHLTFVPVTRDGQLLVVYGFSRDITKQINAENELEASQSLMAQGQFVGEFGESLYKPDSNTVLCSDRVLNILGFPDGYLLTSREYYGLIHPDDREHVVTVDKAGKRNFADNIFRIIRPDGEVRWLHTRWQLVNINGERVAFGAIKDITETKMMNDNLRLSQELIAQANSIAGIGNWSLELKTEEIHWSDEVVQICGVSEDFRKGLKLPRFIELVVADDQEVFRSFISYAKANRNLAHECEFRIQSPTDGMVRYLHTCGKVLSNHMGDLTMIGTVQEITKRKQTEALLRQSDKLSLAGELAAGVAHEIRNPLTTLKGFLQLLDTGQYELQKQKEYYKIMLDAINHIDIIAGEMLALAKPHTSNVVRDDIIPVVYEVVNLLNAEARLHNVDINVNVQAEKTTVVYDVNQIKQIFVNLIKNAIDSMDTKGTLDVIISDNSELVSIEFKDNGCGIRADQIPKLGQPFYTTKEKGTGLGLMLCNKILHEHHGRLSITSTFGKGTSVTVYLPIAS